MGYGKEMLLNFLDCKHETFRSFEVRSFFSVENKDRRQNKSHVENKIFISFFPKNVTQKTESL